MSDLGLPPDVIGHMAALGGTDEPLDSCPSCQRALIYGAIAHLGAAGAAMDAFEFVQAAEYLANATAILLNFAKVDLVSVADVEDLPNEDWELALEAFLGARIEHYVSDTGDIVFEPHGGEGDNLAGVA